MSRPKKEVDWIALEVDYRANMKTMRVLAKEYGISTARIGQVAEEQSWERDLAAKIAAKTQSKLDRSILDKKLDSESSSTKKATEAQVVEANADLRASIQITHRTDIYRLRTLGLTLLGELEGQSADPSMLEQLGELLHAPDEKGVDKLNELYRKIISTPSRIDSAKKVAETLRHAIGLEREAYGLDDKKLTGTATGDISISF